MTKPRLQQRQTFPTSLEGKLFYGIVIVSTMLTTACSLGTETLDEVETVMVGDIPVRTDGPSVHDQAYRVDEITFELEAGQGFEYKYRLEEDAALVYSWESSGPVRIEMHSEADDQPDGTAEFFDVTESSESGHGAFLAPFPGIHGWYWLNLNESQAISLTLRSAGFYSYAMELRSDSRRRYEPANVGGTTESE